MTQLYTIKTPSGELLEDCVGNSKDNCWHSYWINWFRGGPRKITLPFERDKFQNSKEEQGYTVVKVKLVEVSTEPLKPLPLSDEEKRMLEEDDV